MHYPNEGKVDVNMVAYDIFILSLKYSITLMKVIHV
jgi:hypothetical protein